MFLTCVLVLTEIYELIEVAFFSIHSFSYTSTHAGLYHLFCNKCNSYEMLKELLGAVCKAIKIEEKIKCQTEFTLSFEK